MAKFTPMASLGMGKSILEGHPLATFHRPAHNIEEKLELGRHVAACQGCFFPAASVFILAMVPALFIRTQRRQVWRKGA